MELTLTVLLLFAGQTHAADSHCDATQGSPECSVTLGASVYVQVLTTAQGHRLRCLKLLPSGQVNVLTVKRETVTVEETFRNRTDFFISNGTLKISSVERADAGDFSVNVFSSDGIPVRTIHLKLDVKENILSILILACCALVLLLILVAASCCVFKRIKRHKMAQKLSTENKLWTSL